MSKFHITLAEPIRKDDTAKRRAYDHIVGAFQIQNVNEKRFQRFGIITGEMEDDRVDELRAESEIAAVERDQMVRAIGTGA